MVFAPHILYKKQVGVIQTDSTGKPIAPSEQWVKIMECRCDDDTTQKLTSSNGQVYKSRYHVVYDRNDVIVEGDEIRCMDADGRIRGGGIVGMVKKTNYMAYSELWM